MLYLLFTKFMLMMGFSASAKLSPIHSLKKSSPCHRIAQNAMCGTLTTHGNMVARPSKQRRSWALHFNALSCCGNWPTMLFTFYIYVISSLPVSPFFTITCDWKMYVFNIFGLLILLPSDAHSDVINQHCCALYYCWWNLKMCMYMLAHLQLLAPILIWALIFALLISALVKAWVFCTLTQEAYYLNWINRKCGFTTPIQMCWSIWFAGFKHETFK